MFLHPPLPPFLTIYFLIDPRFDYTSLSACCIIPLQGSPPSPPPTFSIYFPKLDRLLLTADLRHSCVFGGYPNKRHRTLPILHDNYPSKHVIDMSGILLIFSKVLLSSSCSSLPPPPPYSPRINRVAPLSDLHTRCKQPPVA